MKLFANRFPRGFVVAAAVVISAGLIGCAAQRLNDDGMKMISAGESEQGLSLLARASEMEPGNSRFRIDYLEQQAVAVRDLLRRASDARNAGQSSTARELYISALRIDSANELARRGLAAIDMDERHRAVVSDADRLFKAGDSVGARAKLRQVLLENPTNAPAQQLLAQIKDAADRVEDAKRAQIAASSVMKKPVTLQFRDANVRMVFEALSRTTGLNVIFDRDVRADLKTTIFVRDASVDDTVDLILLQNQLEKKVLNANTLFIYPSTAAKQKEYQDLKVRTFQISNADAKYLQNVLKTVLKIKDVALDERTNTLVIRDTPDAIAVAEKIVAAHDVADPEVIIEVQVLEVSRDRVANLGVQWPSGVSVSTPGTANTIGALRGLTRDQLQITAPIGIGANFQLQDTDTNLLASPRIRARNKEKAKILIGDKVPVITNSVTPVSTGGQVVTGSVQYIDVGIKLEVEPQVYSEGDVGIKLNLEVSNIVKQIGDGSQNSTLAYQIGTRSASTNLRLRDGETQILGGLISDSDRSNASKVPGLGQLPVLGRLFSNNSGDTTKTEIILSITPHIVRGAGTADANLRDIYSGTESSIKESPLRLDPVGSVRGASAPTLQGTNQPAAPVEPGNVGGISPLAPLPGAPAAPATPPAPSGAPADNAPATTPAPAPSSSSSGLTPAEIAAATTAAAAPAVAPAGAAPAAAPSSAPMELTLTGPQQAGINEEFTVILEANVYEPVSALPVVVRFDPLALQLMEARPEELALASGIAQITPRLNSLTGRLDLDLRAAADKPFSRSGKLVALRFKSRLPRTQTSIAVAQIDLKDGGATRTIAKPAPLLLRLGQ